MWYFYTTFPSALALVIVSFKGAPTALVKPTNLSDITLELGQRLARHMTKVLKRQALNDEVVLREDRGPVAVLTLNRPEARNSLSLEMIAALHGEVKDLGGSDAIRAIVITGAGSAFSSGHDLKEIDRKSTRLNSSH